MLFTSKIREVARQLGVTVGPLALKDPAADAIELGAETRLVIFDLRLPGALELLGRITKNAAQHADRPAGTEPPAGMKIRTIGFIDHERTDVMDSARALGCDEVMTKGQFSSSLPRLLKPPG